MQKDDKHRDMGHILQNVLAAMKDDVCIEKQRDSSWPIPEERGSPAANAPNGRLRRLPPYVRP
eukprot:1272945-Prorocentrum_lima.AAC.1